VIPKFPLPCIVGLVLIGFLSLLLIVLLLSKIYWCLLASKDAATLPQLCPQCHWLCMPAGDATCCAPVCSCVSLLPLMLLCCVQPSLLPCHHFCTMTLLPQTMSCHAASREMENRRILGSNTNNQLGVAPYCVIFLGSSSSTLSSMSSSMLSSMLLPLWSGAATTSICCCWAGRWTTEKVANHWIAVFIWPTFLFKAAICCQAALFFAVHLLAVGWYSALVMQAGI